MATEGTTSTSTTGTPDSLPTNQHFQPQPEHRYNQEEEEQEKEEQQGRDQQNHTLHRSPTFYDLFAEVMNERLLEMCDWETLSQENQQERDQLFEVESATTLEQPALVQDDAEQSPRIHAFESSAEGEHQKKKPMAEECDQTPLENIQNNATLHSFDFILTPIEQMEELQETDPSPGTPQQHAITTERSSYNKKNTDT